VRELAELCQMHFVRQGEPLGLGHAVAMARQHVGDEPFAVMLGDDIMVDDALVLRGMLEASAEHGASVIALREVPPEEISAYGCAAVEGEGQLRRLTGIVEKPAPADAPSNLAVMGRYVLTPSIFGALERITPGKGGELQLTDAIALLLQEEPVYGFVFSEGRYDIGSKMDYLRATVELAAKREDLGEPFRTFLVDFMKRQGWC
jgi:UTP--glucose-1-phosphate uridylyltransferase